ncbi:hypothetical protein, partial [Anoxynatronum buryatiense]
QHKESGDFEEWLTFSSAQSMFLAHYQISIGNLRIADQQTNIMDKYNKGRGKRDEWLYNKNTRERIVTLHDEGRSYREIAQLFTAERNRKPAYDHKTILKIYRHYKRLNDEDPKRKPVTQQSLMINHHQELLDLVDRDGHSLTAAAKILGEKYRNGQSFDQQFISELYKTEKTERGEPLKQTMSNILWNNLEIVCNEVNKGGSQRDIAQRVSKALKLSNTLNHTEVMRVYRKHMKSQE